MCFPARLWNYLHTEGVVGFEGKSLMISSEYFRGQAELCLRLAKTFGSQKGAAELAAMAEDFIAKADLIDAEQSQRPIADETTPRLNRRPQSN
jgi:hypothetical protein